MHYPYILNLKFEKPNNYCKYSFCPNDYIVAYFVANPIARNAGNVLFNDALNTFYLRSYGVELMVKPRKPDGVTSWATLSD